MHAQTHSTSGSTLALRRLAIVVAGAALAFLLAPKRSSATTTDPCPIQGCGDDVARTCGVCSTINGNYAVYFD